MRVGREDRVTAAAVFAEKISVSFCCQHKKKQESYAHLKHTEEARIARTLKTHISLACKREREIEYLGPDCTWHSALGTPCHIHKNVVSTQPCIFVPTTSSTGPARREDPHSSDHPPMHHCNCNNNTVTSPDPTSNSKQPPSPPSHPNISLTEEPSKESGSSTATETGRPIDSWEVIPI